MKLASFEAIVRVLNEASVRYLIAGGLAVNAHGYLRFTKDADIVVDLVADNIERALRALQTIGYKPTLPVTIEQFADPKQRKRWIENKGMQVFQLWSDAHRETPIDLFVELPFDFDTEYRQALAKPLYGNIDVWFVSIETLIAMKRSAGRPQDHIDIEHLLMRLDDDD